MADQLDLAIVLKAILDSKGFDDAQKALKGLAGQANAAKAPTEALGKGQKELSRELGGSRGAVADLTRVLLQNVGVTGEAGEVAKAAGAGMNFLTGAAGPLAVAASGLVAVVALLAPHIIEFFHSEEDAAEATKKLHEQILNSIPDLRDYKDAIGELTKLQRGLLQIKYEDTLRAQRQETADLAKQAAGLREQIEGLLAPQLELVGRIQRGGAATFRMAEASAEHKKQAADLAITLADVEVKIAALNESTDKGTTLTDAYADAQQRAAAKLRAREKATEDAARAQKALDDAIAEGVQGQSEARQRGIQDLLKKDSDAIAAREKKARKGRLTDELIEKLTVFDQEAQAKRDLVAQEEAIEKQAARDKRARDAELIATGTAGLTAFFGHNKAAMIAQALVDTYAGAAKAFAQTGIGGFVTGAAIIAQGLANVAQIRKQNIGFDDPLNDAIVRQFGRKWANDMASLLNEGFYGQVGALTRGGGGGSVTNNYHQVYNTGSTNQYGPISGLMANNPTQFLRGLERAEVRANRFKRRTTLGR